MRAPECWTHPSPKCKHLTFAQHSAIRKRISSGCAQPSKAFLQTKSVCAYHHGTFWHGWVAPFFFLLLAGLHLFLFFVFFSFACWVAPVDVQLSSPSLEQVLDWPRRCRQSSPYSDQLGPAAHHIHELTAIWSAGQRCRGRWHRCPHNVEPAKPNTHCRPNCQGPDMCLWCSHRLIIVFYYCLLFLCSSSFVLYYYLFTVFLACYRYSLFVAFTAWCVLRSSFHIGSWHTTYVGQQYCERQRFDQLVYHVQISNIGWPSSSAQKWQIHCCGCQKTIDRLL